MISVDTKKKELVGDYKNAGSDYRPEGCPDEVNVHDFVDKELGKAIPYGVYDIGANAGCVSVGIDHDTAQFAVNAIRRWRETMGRERYPDGRSPDDHRRRRRLQWQSRVRLWKVELQKLADETGLRRNISLSVVIVRACGRSSNHGKSHLAPLCENLPRGAYWMPRLKRGMTND